MDISLEEFISYKNHYKNYSVSFLNSLAEKLSKKVSELNENITEYTMKDREDKERELILTKLVLKYMTLREYNEQLNKNNIERFLRQQYEVMTHSCVPAYFIWLSEINNKSNLFSPQKSKDNQLSFVF